SALSSRQSALRQRQLRERESALLGDGATRSQGTGPQRSWRGLFPPGTNFGGYCPVQRSAAFKPGRSRSGRKSSLRPERAEQFDATLGSYLGQLRPRRRSVLRFLFEEDEKDIAPRISAR